MTDKKERQICYRRQMGQNEMMICADSCRETCYETRMMKNNEIPGLLKFSLRRMDDQCWFCYQITSLQPLGRLLETRTLTAEPIRRILHGMIRTFQGLGEYLLSEEQILLEPEYLYINLDDWTPKLCLIPGKEGDFSGEFSRLLQFLLEKTDHQDKEAVALIYSLYRESLKENYGFAVLLELLAEPGEKGRERDMSDQRQKKQAQQERKVEPMEPYQEAALLFDRSKEETRGSEKTPEILWQAFELFRKLAPFLAVPFIALLLLWIWKGKQGLAEYGKTVGLGSVILAAALAFLCCREKTPEDLRMPENLLKDKTEEPPSWAMIFEPEQEREEMAISEAGKMPEEEEDTHTTLLWSRPEMENSHRLISTDGKNGDIEIGYYPFLIGKQESLSDHILNRDTVSRLHIRLDREGEICRLTDLNSTNGTSVNGRRLEANEMVELKPGDEILIADQHFRFQ